MAGQGTAALELFEDAGPLDLLLVCVGGGGLIAGCATAATGCARGTRVIGVEPEAGDDTRRSLRGRRAGADRRAADDRRRPAAADAGRLTFPVVQARVDDIVTVTDDEIVAAMRLLFERAKTVAEPCGACAFAALLAGKVDAAGARVGVTISGGNVTAERFAGLITDDPGALPVRLALAAGGGGGGGDPRHRLRDRRRAVRQRLAGRPPARAAPGRLGRGVPRGDRAAGRSAAPARGDAQARPGRRPELARARRGHRVALVRGLHRADLRDVPQGGAAAEPRRLRRDHVRRCRGHAAVLAGGAGGIAFTTWALRAAGMSTRRAAQSIAVFLAIMYPRSWPPAGWAGSAAACRRGRCGWAWPRHRRLRRRGAAHARSPATWNAGPASWPAATAEWPGSRPSSPLCRPSPGRRRARRSRSIRRRPSLLGWAVLWWAADVAVLDACFRAFGEAPALGVLIMGYFLGHIGNLLPMPGGVGGVEGGMVGVFVACGMPLDVAVVGTIAYQVISTWLPVAPGLAAYWSLRRRWPAGAAGRAGRRATKRRPSPARGVPRRPGAERHRVPARPGLGGAARAWNALVAGAKDTHATAAVALCIGAAVFAIPAALTWRVDGAAVPYMVASACSSWPTSRSWPPPTRAPTTRSSIRSPAAWRPCWCSPSRWWPRRRRQRRGRRRRPAGGRGRRARPRRRGGGDAFALAFALGVGVCIASYTLVDDHGVEHAAPLPTSRSCC